MTVRELMDELSHYPADARIVVDHSTGAFGLYHDTDLDITSVCDGDIMGEEGSYRVTLEAERLED